MKAREHTWIDNLSCEVILGLDTDAASANNIDDCNHSIILVY